MILRRNAFIMIWCWIAFSVPLSSHAGTNELLGRDYVIALNPVNGSAFRLAMVWYLKGIADQREVKETVTNRMNKMPQSDWATCRNKFSAEELATKVSEKIIELKLEQQVMAIAVSMAVGAVCDSQEDKLYKLSLQIQ